MFPGPAAAFKRRHCWLRSIGDAGEQGFGFALAVACVCACGERLERSAGFAVTVQSDEAERAVVAGFRDERALRRDVEVGVPGGEGFRRAREMEALGAAEERELGGFGRWRCRRGR